MLSISPVWARLTRLMIFSSTTRALSSERLGRRGPAGGWYGDGGSVYTGAWCCVTEAKPSLYWLILAEAANIAQGKEQQTQETVKKP
jgi:hypothetical protein